MLDMMRKHSRSFIIYVFLGIIIAVFVINFGPQSAGCAPSVTTAGRVAGRTVTITDVNYALSVRDVRRNRDATSDQLTRLRAAMIDQLVVRELLAEEALSRGIRVSDDDVRAMLLRGRFLALGQPRPIIRNDEGSFDYDLLSRYARYYWGISVKKFREQQRRELLAERLRQVIASAVQVSDDEVQAEFFNRSEQVTLTYLRFTPSSFRDQVHVTDAERAAFAKKEAKRIAQFYKDNKQAFSKLPPQVRVELIQVDVKGDGAAALQAARARAEALRARISAGEPFAAVARDADPPAIAAGGALGWRDEKSFDVYPKARAAILALAPGKLSPVLVDGKRLLVVRVLGRRKGGDLTLAEATPEIADDLLRQERAREMARKAAEAALARVKGGARLTEIAGKPLAEGGRPLPDAEETGAFPRSGTYTIPGIGASRELMHDAFKLKKGQTGAKVYDTAASFIIFAVKEHQLPDPAAWAKQRDRLVERFLYQKRADVVRRYTLRRCRQAAADNDVRINAAVALVTPGFRPEPGKPLPTYRPCASLGLGPLASMGGLPFALPGGGPPR